MLATAGRSIDSRPEVSIRGPGLNTPFEGAAASTFGDRYAFNHWLASGGNLGKALSAAGVSGDVILLGEFFASGEASLSADRPWTPAELSAAAGGAEGGGAGAGGVDDPIDFTRVIPQFIPTDPLRPDIASRHIRATPDGAFYVFASNADLGFGSNLRFQIYRATVDNRDVATIDLVSRDTTGAMATADCDVPSVSADGLVIAFETAARLDPALDSNSLRDVYVRDFRSPPPVTRLISRASGGMAAGNGDSFRPCVSGNGVVVAFTSRATNLLGDGCCTGDNVYVVGSDADEPDMQRVSVDSLSSPCGTCSGSLSRHLNNNGSLVVFTGFSPGWRVEGSSSPLDFEDST
jgi:hypothetical protein